MISIIFIFIFINAYNCVCRRLFDEIYSTNLNDQNFNIVCKKYNLTFQVKLHLFSLINLVNFS